jgi:ammonia channel protein AmtB
VILIQTSSLAGSVADRMTLPAFILLIFTLNISVFPVAASWSAGEGWLYRIGYIDDTGSSFIFMACGLSGFVANLILGPRLGVFAQNTNKLKDDLNRLRSKPRKRASHSQQWSPASNNSDAKECVIYCGQPRLT